MDHFTTAILKSFVFMSILIPFVLSSRLPPCQFKDLSLTLPRPCFREPSGVESVVAKHRLLRLTRVVSYRKQKSTVVKGLPETGYDLPLWELLRSEKSSIIIMSKENLPFLINDKTFFSVTSLQKFTLRFASSERIFSFFFNRFPMGWRYVMFLFRMYFHSSRYSIKKVNVYL